jgi:hypothetical protein
MRPESVLEMERFRQVVLPAGVRFNLFHIRPENLEMRAWCAHGAHTQNQSNSDGSNLDARIDEDSLLSCSRFHVGWLMRFVGYFAGVVIWAVVCGVSLVRDDDSNLGTHAWALPRITLSEPSRNG